MNTRLLLLVLVLVYVGTCSVLRKNKSHHKYIHGRPKGGLVPKITQKGPKFDVSPDQFVTLHVDHFNSSNTQTYQKRYWYNDAWFKTGGPVFLYSIGEATGTSDWAQGGSLMAELALSLGAYVFVVEHRYYGQSKVPGQSQSDISTYKYLSSPQELGDLAEFVTMMNAKFNFPQGQKWVTFGGSYAGGLTALSREVHPDVFYAAVGSSGVVNALVDYVGYMNVVQDVISGYTNTQTNLNCGQTYKEAITQIQALIATANGRQQLFKGFKLCQPLDMSNTLLIGNFWSSILGAIMGDVQYGQYDNDCAMLTDTANGNDALTRMQYFINYVYITEEGASCNDIDYNDYITEVNEDPDYFNWLYQTCSEFGWYQSSDGAYNQAFWGNTLPVSWYLPECAKLYNINNASVYANADWTNQYFGGSSGYNATMVVLPNGLADPWHLVGVLNATNSQQTIVLIPGGSHCEDMYGDSDSDTPAMKAAKKTIKDTVTSWFSS